MESGKEEWKQEPLTRLFVGNDPSGLSCLPATKSRRGWCPIDVLIVARLGASHLLSYSEHSCKGWTYLKFMSLRLLETVSSIVSTETMMGGAKMKRSEI